MRAVEAGGSGCEPSDAFLVAEDKLGLKGGESPFGKRAQTKFLGGRGEKAGLLNHRQGESDDGNIGKGDVAERCYALFVRDFRPEVFDRVVEVPWLGESRTIGLLELFGS